MHLVLDLPLVFFVCSAMGYAQLKDSTMTKKIILATLDAQIDPTPSLITTSALDCTTYSSCWGQAAVHPRRGDLLLDLISQVFLRSLQNGIAVMGFIDALVYAHHQYRRNVGDPGNFGDNMKGRIRFMTAITPAYAHAYQATCLTRHLPAILRQNFRPPKPKAKKIRTFPTLVPLHAKEAVTSEDGLFMQTQVFAA